MQRYPAIKSFVRGYLHEDAATEYGSAEAAAERFCKDADSGELSRLWAEWSQFNAMNTHLDDINKTLGQLGCAWQFQSFGEFCRMLVVFENAAQRRLGLSDQR